MRGRSHLALLLLTVTLSAQTPEPDARLEGQVIDPLHEPVVNAEVTVEHDGIVVATTHSDGQGAFVFPRVPSQFVVVRATTDAPDIGAVAIDLWGLGRGFARVRTMPARRVSGTVRDDAGDPVADAWVLASPNQQYQGLDISYAHCKTRSDANGRYELRHIALGPVSIRAWTPRGDAAAFAGGIDGNADTTLDCTIARGEAEWCTFQLEGASAVQKANAELRVVAFLGSCPMPLPPTLCRPTATEPGLWDVSGWTTADRLHAWVVLPDATMWPEEHVVHPGVGTTKRRFDLGDGDAAIRGRIRDAAGRPVAGIQLLAQPLKNLGGLNSRRRTAVTTPKGEFTVQAPLNLGEQFAIRSMSPQFALVGNDANPVWFVENHTDEEWELQARKAQAVRLHVEDARGIPQSGVLAALTQQAETTQLVGNGTSGLDGSIEISCLALELPATLSVSALGPGGIGHLETAARASKDQYLGRIKLEPAASIHGGVTDGEGNAVPGARVRIRPVARGMSVAFILASDRAGRFRLRGIEPGMFVVGSNGTEEVVVVEAGAEAEVELVLDR